MRRRRRSLPFLVFITIAMYSASSVVFLLCSAVPSKTTIMFGVPSNITRIPQVFDSTMNHGKHNEYIFIGIKTSETGAHGERLPQIRKTWIKDALESAHDVQLQLFTHVHANITNEEQESMVTTNCQQLDLACKTGQVFAYYLQHSHASWFCSFDDDNYVNIPRLIQVLQEYEHTVKSGQDFYIGRALHVNGMYFEAVNATVHFGTGGAGYCLNRNLVVRGSQYFTKLERFHLIDDVAVGYVSQHKLQVKITSDALFHSHWERMIRTKMPRDEIDQQVSFAHDNKGEFEFPYDDLPSTPILFPREKDPMGFRSLWCYLHREKNVKDSPECIPTDTK